ncbi:serine protease family S28, partial [Achlya hypogyna]
MLAPKALALALLLPLLVSALDAASNDVVVTEDAFDMNVLREIYVGNDTSSDLEISNRVGSDTKQDLWFDGAILDHNDPQSGTWKQRYQYNDEWYGGAGSPVFLYINGEWEAKAATVSERRSTMNEMAKRHKAMVVAVEHRYYGDSIPNGDQTDSAMKKHLTSDEALADLVHKRATFHAFFTKEHDLQGAPWIAWGYSYAGMLSAWFKLKYPTLVAGAVSSSAPVQAQVDMKEYAEGVTRGLMHHGGQECVDHVRSAMTDLHALVDADSDDLYAKFGVCGKLGSTRSKYLFEWNMAHAFKGMAQYKTLNGHSLASTCHYLKNQANGATALDRLSTWYMSFTKACPPKTQTPTPTTDQPGWVWNRLLKQTANNQFGQWAYQTCKEFGFLQTTSSGTTPFAGLEFISPNNVFSYSSCARFGIDRRQLILNVMATNAKYGGWDIDVENVLFTNGEIDPWAGLSVTKQPKNPKSRFIVIKGATHCEDAYLPWSAGPLKDAIQ